ncbi:hypothetical protein [Polaribacter sp. P097]|uniref:hypothetical protein n=1 Tax=Polaribacter sp. P097 TaxID=3117398 RepID=UPI002FE33D23
MKRTTNQPHITLAFLIFFFTTFSIFSQQSFQDLNIEDEFKNYTQPYEEVMYAHLNKTKFIVGENIGYTVYAFNKKNKILSSVTTNIYCVITDKNNKVVKEQMIKAEDGIASGSFFIDDKLFKEGSYNFRAYTNWMMNFSYQNIFSENFEVLGTNSNQNKSKLNSFKNIDLQVLPESGHLLGGLINTVGIIAKDSLGFGLSNVEGKILNSENKEITNFKLNDLGIGRASFIPKNLEAYKAVIKYNGTEQTILLKNKVEPKGVILKVTSNNDYALLSIVANENTREFIKNNNYKLVLHDGKNIETIPVNFNDKLTHTLKIPLEEISKGVNIFTLFNEENIPVSERLFFNFKGLNLKESKLVSSNTKNGKTTVNFQFNNSKIINNNNVSVSVLPKGTKSYRKNTNMISQILLEPYVNGFIENANYYFSDMNLKKQLELDNLLLTQGWSSYDWLNIYNNKQKINYTFDEGIAIKFNVPAEKKESKFLIHPLKENEPQLISFNDKVSSFTASKYFPEEDEKLYLSKINRNGKAIKTPVYAQFSPNQIPDLKDKLTFLKAKPNYYSYENLVDINSFIKLNNTEVLSEIEIKAKTERDRIERIKNTAFGKVKFLNDNDRVSTLATYLNAQAGIAAIDDHRNSTFRVYSRSADGVPSIFINDFFTNDYSIYYNYFLDNVEYVEINPLGIGPMQLGTGGTIKVYENYKKFKNYRPALSKIDFPVTFSKSKQFYIPKYANSNNNFFKSYGVLDWLPKNKINESGNLNLSFNSNNVKEIVLYIEGITESGDFILEEKLIKTE